MIYIEEKAIEMAELVDRELPGEGILEHMMKELEQTDEKYGIKGRDKLRKKKTINSNQNEYQV